MNLYFILGIFNGISPKAKWKPFTKHDTYMDFLKGLYVIRISASFCILLKNIVKKIKFIPTCLFRNILKTLLEVTDENDK